MAAPVHNEYNDSTRLISVFNLPLYDLRIKCKDVNYFGTIKDLTFLEFIEYVEFLLNDIVDLLVKSQLSGYTDNTPGNENRVDFDYYLCGGKALNNSINSTFLKKSFDFDIHVSSYDDDDRRRNLDGGDSLTNFSTRITRDINNFINNHWTIFIRKQIYRILRLNNIVSDEEEAFYIQNIANDNPMIPENPLFFRGVRGDIGVNIKHGLFMKLKFRNDLFYKIDTGPDVAYIYTNYQGGQLRNIVNLTPAERRQFHIPDVYPGHAPKTEAKVNGFTTAQKFNTKSRSNIIYMPYADILKENIINNTDLGFKIYKTSNNKNSIYSSYGIKYIDYPTMIANLINYLFLINTKTVKNLQKLKRILKPFLFNCSFLSNHMPFFNDDDIRDSRGNRITILEQRIGNILSQLLNNVTFPNYRETQIIVDKIPIELMINNVKVELFPGVNPNVDINIRNILNKVFTNYKSYYNYAIGNCQYLMSNQPNPVLNVIGHLYFFINGITNQQKIEIKTLLERIAFNSDQDNSFHIYDYTQNLYRSLNTYEINRSNQIATGIITPRYVRELHIRHTRIYFSDGTNSRLDQYNDFDYSIANYPNISESMDATFELFQNTINNPEIGVPVLDYINDQFTVYSFQDMLTYSTNSVRNMSGISNAKPGDIFVLPKYVSTTLKQNVNLGEIFRSNREFKTIFRIIINKNNRNWMYLNNYSAAAHEKELLIKRNSAFIIKNTETAKIHSDGTDYDINFITVELLNNLPAPEQLFLATFDKALHPFIGLSYNNNVLSSQIFKAAAQYTYNNLFSHPYDDATALINRFGDTLGEFTIEATQRFRDGDGIDQFLNRPNHGLTHAIRVSTLIYVNALNLYKYNSVANCRAILTPSFILKATIAGLFIVSGRCSEIGYAARLT